MRIKVTQEDLDKGQRYSVWNSPLSYAFRREFKSRIAFVGATICLDNFNIELIDKGLEMQTAFDMGKKLEPFEIQISGDAIHSRILYRK